jgi:choline dehydrogenase-like flavoprotein
MVARALGGCGIHNAMLYVRALEEDFKVPRSGKLYIETHIYKVYIR